MGIVKSVVRTDKGSDVSHNGIYMYHKTTANNSVMTVSIYKYDNDIDHQKNNKSFQSNGLSARLCSSNSH